jgi:tetratricopeptide (TPR) repeat protein
VREIGAGSSYLSQNAPEAIFGLGAAQKAEWLTVRWPSGLVQRFENLAADRAYRLVEGEASPQPVASSREKTLAFWDAYRKARDLAAAGRRPEATAAYREALALDPRHEDSLYALGNLLLDAGNAAGARDAFQAQLRVQPHSGRAHGALGDLYADTRSGRLHDLAAARREYEQAGRLNAEETGWVVRLAEVDLARGAVPAAERGFRHVLVTNQRSFPALYFSGYLAFRNARKDEARRLFDRSFAALAPPPGAPAPSEGDVKTPQRLLPRRGVFSRHWEFLARGPVPMPMEQAYAALDTELKARPSR